MADDGIELNFAVPASGVAVRHVAAKKGGRWTDRVKAKRDARDSYKNLKQTATNVSNSAPAPAPVPFQPKAQPAPASFVAPPKPRPQPAASVPQVGSVSASVNAVAGPSRSQSITKPAVSTIHKPRSSLPTPSVSRSHPPARSDAGPSRLPATSIPASSQPKAPQFISSLFTADPLPAPASSSQPAQPVGAPSNAPLVSDTSTFADLGMDPLLIRHLKNKMHVENPTGIQRSCLPYMLSSPLDPDQIEDTSKPLRDVLIQAQTGSGKTLSYLLPIIQTLLPLSKLSYIDRSIGTLAIILAPTRELAQQISKVVEQLISMSLTLDEEDDRQFTRWLVSGLLTGGSTRTHEKARLRKGLPILVSTPGRLLDHLQNTSSFQCAKTMFLVLDEADRLMDLGFEETIKGILKALEGRRKNEINIEKEMDEEGGGGAMRWNFWNRGRTNILCSATVDPKVEKLSGMALRDPIVFRSNPEKGTQDSPNKKDMKDDAVKAAIEEAGAIVIPKESEEKFTPPSQLSQKYVVIPTKLRLVALVALLRSLIASAAKVDTEKGTKIIVFLSSTDSVDFHWKLLGGVQMGDNNASADSEEDGEEDEDGNESTDEVNGTTTIKSRKTKKGKKSSSSESELITLSSPLFPNTTLHRLHGSLPLRTRMASLRSFAGPSSQPSVLFATSVASRGLDLPLVRAVIQYDLPTEGGANEYVHRVGRTARAGKGGEAWAFISQNEIDWVPWVENKMGNAEGEGKGGVKLQQVGVEDVLRKGFGGQGYEFENRATEVQLGFERWVLDGTQNAALARKAYSSFIRAYSTHPLEEKKFFHIKSVHLGHLAKSFALREAPGQLSSSSSSTTKNSTKVTSSATAPGKKRKHPSGEGDDGDDAEEEVRGGKELTARNETERRMYEAVRKQGRMIKSGGKLGEFAGSNKNKKQHMSSNGGGGEFQVYGTSELERMVSGKK
ncbi:ATP-dependent RNA helicase DBP7 [Kwoniella mangroviensis CBS 10435]|uniref:ATP-dependent RNA helicase n=1 Tax=Kwoniella mangroviensis CBS 10435 TaxID=1331196 RepID=A0A1B9IT30_9TREE|nr:ATP-dependent RNA helicase DBP7 [Kwoniella mangroviensis CBS 10435]